MSPEFETGCKCNLYFYTYIGILSVFMGIVTKRLPLIAVIILGVYVVLTVFAFSKARKKPGLNCILYGKLQTFAFLIPNVALSITYDSAQVFIYALCFSSVINFTFISNKLSNFYMLYSMSTTVGAGILIAIFVDTPNTMMEYSFGGATLFIVNWVIISMTGSINFKNRVNEEQEKSLDDMLKVVEAKCDDARNATRSKSNFLAQMSHEIRTPINAIIGMNEMILRESKEENISGYAVEAKSAADSLLGIINDILDITKIEAGRVTSIPVQYKTKDFIEDIYSLIKFKAKQKDLEFKLIVDKKLPSIVIGDDIRLKQILVNLLGNAVKYTHEGGITLEVSHLEKNKFFFSVRDTGIGIKQEDMGKLFAAFDRIEEEKNRRIEGTGLGLSITSSLLKMFGSELKVESIYGIGSEFSFVIKQEIVDSSPIGEIDLSTRSYEQKSYTSTFVAPDAKVLVVDDNDMNLKVFTSLLKETKIQITEALSGQECLDLVAENRYDIIFMDHMMPGMDGVEALAAMKKLEANQCTDTPVIALTANAVVGAKEFYLSVGFDGFLSKPVDPKKLENMVFSLLKKELTQENIKEEAESVEEEELPMITGLDWNYAKTHFTETKTLLEAIGRFYKSIRRDADELNYYFEGIQDEELLNNYRIKVHSMKSSAALVGIVHLAGMAMELEGAARNQNTDIIKAVHPVFIERWLGYIGLLSELVETSEPKKEASENEEEIKEIFSRIREAAAEMDVDKLDKLSAMLDEYRFEGEMADKIEDIKTSIFNFEVEKLSECEY